MLLTWTMSWGMLGFLTEGFMATSSFISLLSWSSLQQQQSTSITPMVVSVNVRCQWWSLSQLWWWQCQWPLNTRMTLTLWWPRPASLFCHYSHHHLSSQAEAETGKLGDNRNSIKIHSNGNLLKSSVTELQSIHLTFIVDSPSQITHHVYWLLRSFDETLIL